MNSAFNTISRRKRFAPTVQQDETYDLRGNNLVAPDQITPDGESPYTINSRSYPREDDERRVSIRTRKGSAFMSEALGETADAKNDDTATGDVAFSTTTWVAMPFTPDSDGLLTKIGLEMKNPGVGGGYILVGLYTDVGGAPGAMISTSSLPSSQLGSSYEEHFARFMDAPLVDDETDYWILVRLQELGTSTLNLNKTAEDIGLVTTDSGSTYVPMGAGFRFSTYVSPSNEIIGYVRQYTSTNDKATYFATSDGKLHSVADNGTITEVGSGEVDASATYVRFAQANDKLMWVDGKSNPKWYDGSSVSSISNAPDNSRNIIVYHNRLFFVTDDANRVEFSNLYPDFTTYDSTDFFYIPSPKSPSPITAWVVFQDTLVIFTRETKYVVSIGGTGIDTITIQEAVGTKGAVSQEAVAVDRNGIFFMADDNQIYRWNGATDALLSTKVEPELNSILLKNKVRFHLYRNQLRIYYPKSPSVIIDRMLLFDIEQSQWFMDTGRSVMGSLEWTLDDNQLVEFSSRTGQLFFGERGYSDLGKPIAFKYYTNYKAYGSGAAKDRIRRFRPIIRPANADYYLMVGKDIDFKNQPDMRRILIAGSGIDWGSGEEWGSGTATWGGGSQIVDSRVPMSGRGKFTQYRFENEGVETPVELYGYISIYVSGKIR